MAERITKQMELIQKELNNSHGVAILRKKLNGGGEYEYVFITTPSPHISAKANTVTSKAVTAPSYGRMDARTHELIKRIEHAETV